MNSHHFIEEENARLKKENAALRDKIQNESESCKCSSCTDRVPKLFRENVSLKERIRVLEECLELANELLDTIPYRAMTKYQTCGDADAITVLEAWNKKFEALKSCGATNDKEKEL